MSERGGQAPPPQRQSGKQQRDPPSNGHGVNVGSKNKEESEQQLKVCYIIHHSTTCSLEWFRDRIRTDALEQELTSNPKGPLDDHVEELAKKKYKNVAGELTDA